MLTFRSLKKLVTSDANTFFFPSQSINCFNQLKKIKLKYFPFLINRILRIGHEGQKRNFAKSEHHANGAFIVMIQERRFNLRCRTGEIIYDFFPSIFVIKIISFFVFHSCVCNNQSACVLTEDNLSITAYIFRCLELNITTTTIATTSTTPAPENIEMPMT